MVWPLLGGFMMAADAMFNRLNGAGMRSQRWAA